MGMEEVPDTSEVKPSRLSRRVLNKGAILTGGGRYKCGLQEELLMPALSISPSRNAVMAMYIYL